MWLHFCQQHLNQRPTTPKKYKLCSSGHIFCHSLPPLVFHTAAPRCQKKSHPACTRAPPSEGTSNTAVVTPPRVVMSSSDADTDAAAAARFFRLSRLLVDKTPDELRLLYERRWNAKYPATPWDNTRASGRRFLYVSMYSCRDVRRRCL